MEVRPLARLAAGALGLVAALPGALPAPASDGVLEIDQACVAAGCFPGDGAGFPVEITVSGSYQLTGDLELPDAGTSGITVSAARAEIDLNGFTIRGVTDCVPQGAPPDAVVCSSTGGGVGIAGGITTDLAIHDGAIVGMGAQGVLARERLRLADLLLAENGGAGVELISTGAVLRSVLAVRNGGHGVAVAGGVLREVLAQQNGGDGLSCVDCVVVDSQLKLNVGDGIDCANCTVRGNFVTLNRGAGLRGTSNTGYVENVFVGNLGGQVIGAVEIGSNACDGSTTCP